MDVCNADKNSTIISAKEIDDKVDEDKIQDVETNKNDANLENKKIEINLFSKTSSADPSSNKESIFDNAGLIMTPKPIKDSEFSRKRDIIENISMLQEVISEKLNSSRASDRNKSAVSKLIGNNYVKGDNERTKSISLVNEAIMKLQKSESMRQNKEVNVEQTKSIIKRRSVSLCDNENISRIHDSLPQKEISKDDSMKRTVSFVLDDDGNIENNKVNIVKKKPTSSWFFQEKLSYLSNQHKFPSQFDDTITDLENEMIKQASTVNIKKNLLDKKTVKKPVMDVNVPSRKKISGLPRPSRHRNSLHDYQKLYARNPTPSIPIKRPVSVMTESTVFKRLSRKSRSVSMSRQMGNFRNPQYIPDTKSYSLIRAQSRNEQSRYRSRDISFDSESENKMITRRISRSSTQQKPYIINSFRKRTDSTSQISNSIKYPRPTLTITKSRKSLYESVNDLLKQQKNHSITSRRSINNLTKNKIIDIRKLKSLSNNVKPVNSTYDNFIMKHGLKSSINLRDSSINSGRYPRSIRKLDEQRNIRPKNYYRYDRSKPLRPPLNKRKMLQQKFNHFNKNQLSAYPRDHLYPHYFNKNLSIFMQEEPMTDRNNERKKYQMNFGNYYRYNNNNQRCFSNIENQSIKRHERRRAYTNERLEDYKSKYGKLIFNNKNINIQKT